MKVTTLKDWFAFEIPTECMKSLEDLILNTESMDNTERQYFFDLIPTMTRKQIWTLHEILDTERTKLAELEAEYAPQIKELQKQMDKLESWFITNPIIWE